MNTEINHGPDTTVSLSALISEAVYKLVVAVEVVCDRLAEMRASKRSTCTE